MVSMISNYYMSGEAREQPGLVTPPLGDTQKENKLKFQFKFEGELQG